MRYNHYICGMRFNIIVLSILILMALLACDDEFDESNYVSFPLDTTLMDKSHTTIGYIYSNGSIKDRHYDIVGYINSDGKVTDSHYVFVGSVVKQTESIYKIFDRNYDEKGYVYVANGEVRNSHFDIVGYGTGDHIWKAGALLLLSIH